jgi:protein-S-isoprenylcysteine O-methyltransferase Ste14
MTTVQALGSDDVPKVGIGVILALVVVGLLVFLALSAIIARILVVLVVVGLGLLIWQQRGAVQDRIKNCKFDTSYLGLKVQAPDDVAAQCKRLHRG